MADNKLEVYGLGQFYIKLGSKKIKERHWKSKKTLKLFKLLLINHDREINSEQIVEKIWPTKSLSKGVKRVYDTIYQLRKLLDDEQKESYIVKSPQGYSLNDSKNYWFDWNEFSSIYRKYKNFDLDKDLSENKLYQAIEELESAMNLYQGDFMKNDRYEQWIELPRIHYREIMLNIIMLLAKMFYKLHNTDKALQYLESGIEEEPYREDFYLLAMKILHHEDRCWKVAFLYKKCKETLERELGISPSARLKEEYNKIIENQGCNDQSPMNLSTMGALRCEANVFKEIYKLEKRKMSRQGTPSLLLKITFEEIFSYQLLEELITRISSRLRGEDVITKWDDHTIYILLARTSLENNIKISHRILDSLFLTEVGKDPQLDWKEISNEDYIEDEDFDL